MGCARRRLHEDDAGEQTGRPPRKAGKQETVGEGKLVSQRSARRPARERAESGACEQREARTVGPARGAAPRGLATLTKRDGTAAIPIGTFTKNIHRQDRPEVSRPPRSGADATPGGHAAPDPERVAEGPGAKASASSASETAKMIAPRPCRRGIAAAFVRGDGEATQAEARGHPQGRQVTAGRRPNMSATLPSGERTAARVRGVGRQRPTAGGEARRQRPLDVRQGTSRS